jgi:hypothetical protein
MELVKHNMENNESPVSQFCPKVEIEHSDTHVTMCQASNTWAKDEGCILASAMCGKHWAVSTAHWQAKWLKNIMSGINIKCTVSSAYTEQIILETSKISLEEFYLLRYNAQLCLMSASCWFLTWLTLQPWSWRHLPPKWWLPFTLLQGIIYQKIELFVTTAVRSSYPTSLTCRPPELRSLLAYFQQMDHHLDSLEMLAMSQPH